MNSTPDRRPPGESVPPPGFTTYATPLAAAPTFERPDQLRPGVADGPIMSASTIDATVKSQAHLRAKATGAWVVMTLALSFAGDTQLSVPAGLLWLGLTVGIVVSVTRTNRAVDVSLKSARAVGASGQTISAFRAGRIKGAHQSLCAVAALVTYGTVGRALTTITGTDFGDPTRPLLLNLLPYVVAIAAAVAAYRFMKMKLLERSPA